MALSEERLNEIVNDPGFIGGLNPDILTTSIPNKDSGLMAVMRFRKTLPEYNLPDDFFQVYIVHEEDANERSIYAESIRGMIFTPAKNAVVEAMKAFDIVRHSLNTHVFL